MGYIILKNIVETKLQPFLSYSSEIKTNVFLWTNIILNCVILQSSCWAVKDGFTDIETKPLSIQYRELASGCILYMMGSQQLWLLLTRRTHIFSRFALSHTLICCSKSHGDGKRIVKPDDFIGDRRRRRQRERPSWTERTARGPEGRKKIRFVSRSSIDPASVAAVSRGGQLGGGGVSRCGPDRLIGGVGVHKSEMLLLCIGGSQLRPTPARPTVTEKTSTAVLLPRCLVSVSARFARHTVDIIIR